MHQIWKANLEWTKGQRSGKCPSSWCSSDNPMERTGWCSWSKNINPPCSIFALQNLSTATVLGKQVDFFSSWGNSVISEQKWVIYANRGSTWKPAQCMIWERRGWRMNRLLSAGQCRAPGHQSHPTGARPHFPESPGVCLMPVIFPTSGEEFFFPLPWTQCLD